MGILQLVSLLLTIGFGPVIIAILSRGHLSMLIPTNPNQNPLFANFLIVSFMLIVVFFLYLLGIRDFAIRFTFIFVCLELISSFFNFK
jgi:hypothetical protein